MSDFKALVRCESEEDFDGAWEVFLEQWKDHPIWVKYVSSEWLPKKTQWSQAWRKVRVVILLKYIYAHLFYQDISRFNIDTNNYIESWHLLLKRDYLRLMRKQRVDILIHILVDEVELDLRREEVQITLGFDASRLQKSEKAAHRLAYAIEIGELEAMIKNCEDGTDKVSIFCVFIPLPISLTRSRHPISWFSPSHVMKRLGTRSRSKTSSTVLKNMP